MQDFSKNKKQTQELTKIWAQKLSKKNKGKKLSARGQNIAFKTLKCTVASVAADSNAIKMQLIENKAK